MSAPRRRGLRPRRNRTLAGIAVATAGLLLLAAVIWPLPILAALAAATALAFLCRWWRLILIVLGLHWLFS